jgi:hypothetical protein
MSDWIPDMQALCGNRCCWRIWVVRRGQEHRTVTRSPAHDYDQSLLRAQLSLYKRNALLQFP